MIGYVNVKVKRIILKKFTCELKKTFGNSIETTDDLELIFLHFESAKFTM